MRFIRNLLSGLFLLTPLVHAQIFPTLDPNASPAVTKHVSASVPSEAEVDTPPVSKTKEMKTPPATPVGQSPEEKLAAEAAAADEASRLAHAGSDAYVLGPQDSLNIRVIDMEEIGDDPYPIDLRGYITLPRIGRVHASGLTVEQLQTMLTAKFKEYLQEPVVNISVAEFHSQPVSILGAVETPGVHQILGNKTLFEVISEAGGLKDDAGNTITITRKITNGSLPLPNAVTDPSGRYSIADLNIRSVMSAKNPQDNIPVKPYDVITVPKADLIYVVGAVKRPGGFPLQERANMTVLEALSLSQGLDRGASSNKAKILRTDEATHARVEIPIDIKNILNGKISDQPLMANDILFIPSSTAKLATYRALEALVQTGSGIAIYRP
jgi:polysaccharide export outer membrane protein